MALHNFGIIVWRHGIRARHYVSKNQHPSLCNVVLNTYPVFALYHTSGWSEAIPVGNIARSCSPYIAMTWRPMMDTVSMQFTSNLYVFFNVYMYMRGRVYVRGFVFCFACARVFSWSWCELLNTKKACNTHNTQISESSHNKVVLNISINILRCLF